MVSPGECGKAKTWFSTMLSTGTICATIRPIAANPSTSGLPQSDLQGNSKMNWWRRCMKCSQMRLRSKSEISGRSYRPSEAIHGTGHLVISSRERNQKGAKARSRLAPSVEGIRCWLDDLGIKKVYAPVGGHPLRMVISPKAYASQHEKSLTLLLGGRTSRPTCVRPCRNRFRDARLEKTSTHRRPEDTRATSRPSCLCQASASSAKSATIRSGWCGVSPNGRLRRSMKAVRMP